MPKKTDCLITDLGRQCVRCRDFKSWDEFGNNKVGAHGRHYYCKVCISIMKSGTPPIERVYSDGEGRVCMMCKKYKPWCEYHQNKHGKMGHSSRCRECESLRRNGNPLIEYHKDENGRVCIYCKQYLRWECFSPSKRGYSGRSSACKACVAKLNITRKYKITVKQYEKMIDSQNAKCAICGQQSDKLCVDHNHETGAVRKLLCDNCNKALGLMQDDSNILRSAAEYLEKHK